MFYFCTYFDSNYIIKGLALYRSLVRYAKPFHLWVLCFDDTAYEILQELALPEVIPVTLRDFEKGDRELLRAKSNRSMVEYYFTCTPSLPWYILRHHPEVDIITYLDADLFFFSTPSPIYQELTGGSVLIVGHRFPPHLKHCEVNGIYNVGLLSFRNDDVGLQCLQRWRDQCLEWCYDRVEAGRFADQKYLDDWPVRFPGVVVLQHQGAGLAPWNVEKYSLRLENGQVLVDSQPLVFFHFHGLKQVKRWLYDPNFAQYGTHADTVLKNRIYGPYIQELRQVALWGALSAAQSCVHMSSIRGDGRGSVFLRVARKVYRSLSLVNRLSRGQCLVVIGGKIV
jgi:hypothetical protein